MDSRLRGNDAQPVRHVKAFSEPIHPHILFVIPVLSCATVAFRKGSRARRKVKRGAEV
jgi:hypothetical protein